MIRFFTILALVASALGCSREGEVPQAVAVAMTTQEAADKEVLIATQPTGAKILLKGAEVGATPMKLLIRGDTNVVLEKEGYVRQALMLTPKSDPNVVVTLVAAEGAPETPPAEPVVEPGTAKEDHTSQKTTGKTAKKTGKGEAKPEDEAKDEEGATDTGGTEVAVVAPPPPQQPPPPPPKVEYTTMRQIKDAVAAGKITKSEYNYWKSIIRQKREVEFEKTKQDLRDHKITKAEYEQKIREIRLKYEG